MEPSSDRMDEPTLVMRYYPVANYAPSSDNNPAEPTLVTRYYPVADYAPLADGLADPALVARYLPVANYSYPRKSFSSNTATTKTKTGPTRKRHQNLARSLSHRRVSSGSESSAPGLVDDRGDSEVSCDDDLEYHAHMSRLWESLWQARAGSISGECTAALAGGGQQGEQQGTHRSTQSTPRSKQGTQQSKQGTQQSMHRSMQSTHSTHQSTQSTPRSKQGTQQSKQSMHRSTQSTHSTHQSTQSAHRSKPSIHRSTQSTHRSTQQQQQQQQQHPASMPPSSPAKLRKQRSFVEHGSRTAPPPAWPLPNDSSSFFSSSCFAPTPELHELRQARRAHTPAGYSAFPKPTATVPAPATTTRLLGSPTRPLRQTKSLAVLSPPRGSAHQHQYQYQHQQDPEFLSVFEDDSDDGPDDDHAKKFFPFHKRTKSEQKRRVHLSSATTTTTTTTTPLVATTQEADLPSVGPPKRPGADVFGRILGRRSR